MSREKGPKRKTALSGGPIREGREPEERALWGKDGPKVGQVITIAGTSMQTRWNGHSWVLLR